MKWSAQPTSLFLIRTHLVVDPERFVRGDATLASNRPLGSQFSSTSARVDAFSTNQGASANIPSHDPTCQLIQSRLGRIAALGGQGGTSTLCMDSLGNDSARIRVVPCSTNNN